MDRNTFIKLTRGKFFDRLFAYMDMVGITRIEVYYSGGGDSGGADNIQIIPKKISKNIKEGIEFVEEDLTQPIYDRHGSFADGGGFSVDGILTYDSEKKTVSISGTDHYYDSEEFSEDRNEDWCEDIYSQDNDNEHYGNSEYSFAYLYARDYLKSRLPDEFHNEILIAAMEQEDSAVKYIKEFGKI